MSVENNGKARLSPTPKRENNNSGNRSSLTEHVEQVEHRPDSESDANNEHLIGNVQRIAIIPPNYEGKPKKGHLIFDASFECGMFETAAERWTASHAPLGNLGRVDYVNDNEYDLFIRPDTCCPRFRCWFLFTVENVKADQVCEHERGGVFLGFASCTFTCCSFRELFFILSTSRKRSHCTETA